MKIINEVKKKWQHFSSNALTEVYNRVNEEVTLFNNDLNQVSYSLTNIFIGRVHLLAVCIIWKYEVDRMEMLEK